jgi:NTP pyrophosphatase (non-canonical NTP hydrolase)
MGPDPRLNSRARGVGRVEAMEEEAADLLGILLLFADGQGIDLSAVFVRKWGPFDPAGKPA